MANAKYLHVVIVRVYEDTGRLAGDYRVLVDRLWPRGLRKEEIDYDRWVKELAPSTELRKWYGHDLQRFEEFSQRYNLELKQLSAKAVIEDLSGKARKGSLVLLTATRDIEHSSAYVLQKAIEQLCAVGFHTS